MYYYQRFIVPINLIYKCFPYCFLGIWGVGIATRNANLNKVPLGDDLNSWVFCSDGSVRHNSEEKYKISDLPQECDILVK